MERKLTMTMEINTVLNKDCMEGMAAMDGGIVDLVIADPPHFHGNGGGGGSFGVKTRTATRSTAHLSRMTLGARVSVILITKQRKLLTH